MRVKQMIDGDLQAALQLAIAAPCPGRLAAAVQHAVFPGGARLRPRLILAVARACIPTRHAGRTDAESCREPLRETAVLSASLAMRAAVSIELLHCASLVQDDLPCFDAAETRRGKPSVHTLYGERVSILASDALIMLAFEHLAQEDDTIALNDQLALIRLLARQTGAPHGITAGQAWECEDSIDLHHYHQAKTGSLFAAATQAGALAAGCHTAGWDRPGNLIGQAYQIADDLHDAVGSSTGCGKPVGVDASLGRPNAVHSSSVGAALRRLQGLIEDVLDTLPACPGRAGLIDTICHESQQFVPKEIARSAA